MSLGGVSVIHMNYVFVTYHEMQERTHGTGITGIAVGHVSSMPDNESVIIRATASAGEAPYSGDTGTAR
jgi:hypothetical protein